MSTEPSSNSVILQLGLVAIVAFFAYAIYTGMKPKKLVLPNIAEIELMESAVPAGGQTNVPVEQPASTENTQPVQPVVEPTSLPVAPTQPATQTTQTSLMMDTNGDGYQDTRYWDTDNNSDGVIDTRYFDTDLNGRTNQYLSFDYTQPNGKIWCYDTNEDGYTDFWGWDMNGDNRVETWGWDMNKNNVFDTWGADYNGDGFADYYSYDDNEDGVIDRY